MSNKVPFSRERKRCFSVCPAWQSLKTRWQIVRTILLVPWNRPCARSIGVRSTLRSSLIWTTWSDAYWRWFYSWIRSSTRMNKFIVSIWLHSKNGKPLSIISNKIEISIFLKWYDLNEDVLSNIKMRLNNSDYL